MSAGYEFPVGIIIEWAVGVYKFGSEYNTPAMDTKMDATLFFIALNVGYKFKI
ncbi:MAG: hypothetical protein LBD61_00285 [Endomicrobium sp.]|nr:hypothetical protein [Endomicrobium sp.]